MSAKLQRTNTSSGYSENATILAYRLTLPIQLLRRLATIPRAGISTSPEWQSELQQSEAAGDHRCVVGFRGQSPILYSELFDPEDFPVIPDSMVGPEFGVTATELNAIMSENNVRSCQQAREARGYIGWLLTSTAFLDEQRTIITNHSDAIRRWGLNGAGNILYTVGRPAFSLVDERHLATRRILDTAVRTLLTRWRLQSLVAPDLPVPMRPGVIHQIPLSLMDQITRRGQLIAHPDTFAVPSRDDARAMLLSNSSDNSSHLDEWHDMVAVDNPARNQVSRFARIRTLLHYWRLIQQKFGSMLNRKKGHLTRVMAEFLEVSTDSINDDLAIIERRLGYDWESLDSYAFLGGVSFSINVI